MIYSGWKFILFLVFGGMTSNFLCLTFSICALALCTTRKSTLSHATVFLLQVMHFAKLNKPPLSFKPPLSIKPPPPPSKVLEKNKPPGGLNRGFTVNGNEYYTRFCKDA